VNETKIKELLHELETLQKELLSKNATIDAQESIHAEALSSLQKEFEKSQNMQQSQIADLTVQLEQVLLAREKLHDLLLPNDDSGSNTDKDDRMLAVIQNLQAVQKQQQDDASAKVESAKEDSNKLDQLKVEYESQLSTLQKQLSEQKDKNSSLEEDVKSLLEELDQLRATTTAAAAAAAASSSSSKGDSVNEEALKSLMQAVFVNTVEHFSANDGADKSYTLPQMQKGLRAVLKGITTERLLSSSSSSSS
jgi:DNA repair exonuclease SbcCD ATPase subunit